jgi:hypothetical protein
VAVTTKPKPHKAPAAETGINPKLAALAAENPAPAWPGVKLKAKGKR